MATPRMSGRDMAMQAIAGWTLGLAAAKPSRDGEGWPLAPLHQMLVQEIHNIADSAGLASHVQQVALAEATQVLDAVFSEAERLRILSNEWNAREDS